MVEAEQKGKKRGEHKGGVRSQRSLRDRDAGGSLRERERERCRRVTEREREMCYLATLSHSQLLIDQEAMKHKLHWRNTDRHTHTLTHTHTCICVCVFVCVCLCMSV